MTNIHIIQGKATLGANLMAAKVKGSGKYDHRVMDLTSETCSILFRQRDPLAANLAHRSVRLNLPGGS